MKLTKILNIFILIFFIAFSASFCFSQFSNTPLINNNSKNLQIYELWHIECFEGGGSNRQNYLNKIALEYEKQNPTMLFMVKSIEVDQLENALTQTIPSLISFSEQVAQIVLPHLKPLENEYGVQDNFLQSAKYNGQLMAIPYIASGYCYFTKTNSSKELHLYTANNNMHNATGLVSNQAINNNQTLSSYQCYTKFVNSNNVQLLGTARDLFRITNLENIGKFNVKYQPVDTFTDLVQYLGTTTTNADVLQFANHIISNQSQYKLSSINLFSTKNLNMYSTGNYNLMQQALNKCYVPNIFNN